MPPAAGGNPGAGALTGRGRITQVPPAQPGTKPGTPDIGVNRSGSTLSSKGRGTITAPNTANLTARPDIGRAVAGSIGANAGTLSSRGRIERILPSGATAATVPDVESVRRAAGGEHHRLPPLPPLPGSSHGDYWGRAHDHYDHYGHHWFGDHHSWNLFIGSCATAPWFWPNYYSVYAYPWVYGFYDPFLYSSYGYAMPVWSGYAYAPWWDWCDAPFVYYYYRYPARFSFNLNVGAGVGVGYADAGYTNVGYSDVGVVDDVNGVYNRPLGIWVPGHYDLAGDGEWIWTPGYYSY